MSINSCWRKCVDRRNREQVSTLRPLAVNAIIERREVPESISYVKLPCFQLSMKSSVRTSALMLQTLPQRASGEVPLGEIDRTGNAATEA
jgi:hypothetical protein